MSLLQVGTTLFSKMIRSSFKVFKEGIYNGFDRLKDMD